MPSFKDQLNVIVFSILIIFVSTAIRRFFYSEFESGVVIDFDEKVDHIWVENLHDYLFVYTKHWDNKSFDSPVPHCHAKCSGDDSDLEKYTKFDTRCLAPLVLIRDDEVDLKHKTSTLAETTMPCFLKLQISRIPNAQRGVFSKTKIPKGYIFGPFKGVKRSAYGAEGESARGGGYAWRINDEERENADFYIDSVDEEKSNWMRYVNSARFEEEQNMVPLLFNDTVYYIAYRYIEPDTELLLWYGHGYAKWLGIYVIPSSKHDWSWDYAPPVDDTICPSCPRSKGIRRNEKKHSLEMANNNKAEDDSEEDEQNNQKYANKIEESEEPKVEVEKLKSETETAVNIEEEDPEDEEPITRYNPNEDNEDFDD